MAKRIVANNGDGKLFDPAVFLATAAPGRILSWHPDKQIIFAQGDDSDAVFYIKKGKTKSPSYLRKAKRLL